MKEDKPTKNILFFKKMPYILLFNLHFCVFFYLQTTRQTCRQSFASGKINYEFMKF